MFVGFLQLIEVTKNFPELHCAAGGIVIISCFHPLDDAPKMLLQGQHIAIVEAPLQVIDFFIGRGLSAHIVLEVENFEMGNGPPAIVEQLDHVFRLEITEIEGDAITGMEVAQTLDELGR